MWRGDAKVAVGITVDFDAEALWLEGADESSVSMTKLSQGRYGALVGVPRILEILSRHGLKSTFFVPGQTVEKYPDIVKQIAAAGHEIGHHGYNHAEPISLTPKQERAEIEKGLEVYRKLLGITPKGYRAGSWAPTKLTLELVAEYGMEYDSSLVGDEKPYEIELGGKSIIELPSDWCLDDAPHFFFNFSPRYRAGMSDPDKVLKIWKSEFNSYYRTGGAFVFVVHPQISGRPHRAEMFEEFLKYMKGFPGVWFATCSEIVSEWKNGLKR